MFVIYIIYMTKKLVIVESPAKCAKIQSYLGNNYIVKASFGHITTLDTSKGINAIEISNNYKPKFINIKEKKKYIDQLKKYASQCDEVIIASDLDREGEAIGYHICRILKLNLHTTKRIVFNEITKSAITQAVTNSRTLDMNLIYAQQARQVLDYIIGYDISPVLWKYIKNGISAGRCQTPALRLVNEKEEQIENFTSTNYFDLSGIFQKDDIEFNCKHKKKIKNKNSVLEILEKYKSSVFSINDIDISKSKSKSSAPFITSTLQQECNNKLNMPPSRTMQIAQKLYESGKITYMRTDSKIISEDCLQSIKQYIINQYGKDYYKLTKYKNDSQNTQEAHECIRPVSINETSLSLEFNNQEQKVYDLIWKRTIASQMCDSITEILKVIIVDDIVQLPFECEFQKTLHLGYLKAYGNELIDEISSCINKIQKDDIVNYHLITSEEKTTKSSVRYTEASLIKELEKRGIARPSTFASIIDTLFKREYIVKETRKGKEINTCKLTLQNNTIQNTNQKSISGTETNKKP